MPNRLSKSKKPVLIALAIGILVIIISYLFVYTDIGKRNHASTIQSETELAFDEPWLINVDLDTLDNLDEILPINCANGEKYTEFDFPERLDDYHIMFIDQLDDRCWLVELDPSILPENACTSYSLCSYDGRFDIIDDGKIVNKVPENQQIMVEAMLN